ncbi:MAG: hypothetical protein KDB14_30065 [Planctomycetales bacterium]|nr:hypothetical protein [Planctomycetales bacterium]
MTEKQKKHARGLIDAVQKLDVGQVRVFVNASARFPRAVIDRAIAELAAIWAAIHSPEALDNANVEEQLVTEICAILRAA